MLRALPHLKGSPLLITLSIFVLTSAAILAVTAPAIAQSTTFQITPALKEIKVDPGDQGNFDISLFNKSGEAQAVRVYVRNFSAKGTNGELTFADDNSMSYAAAEWVHLSTSNLLIPADDSATVTVQYIVPPQAEPGGKYASVMFEQISQPDMNSSRDSKVVVTSRMVSLLYFTVSGDIIEAGQLLGDSGDGRCTAVVCGFSVPSFLDKGPVPFQFIFSNTGNVHVRPKGTITISQFGREIAKIPVEDRAVLPNSQRQFASEWQRNLIIGPYQAELNLVFGSNNYSIKTQASFWAFPWQAAVVVGVIAVVVVGLLLSRKYYRLKRLTGSSKTHNS